ncbi:hypothetical protein [Bradyrhizobium genosp. P]|uniref:hypothetical protein n=1 Tax=Bradyrhizobium genosp. P TaxID=83641 RepID=UPI003CF67C32
MFELVILGVIVLAVGYWATMFAMGRRDDVLHGKFVEEEPGAGPAFAMPPVRSAPPAPQRTSKDSLQTLLAVIKQDLNDAART